MHVHFELASKFSSSEIVSRAILGSYKTNEGQNAGRGGLQKRREWDLDY